MERVNVTADVGITGTDFDSAVDLLFIPQSYTGGLAVKTICLTVTINPSFVSKQLNLCCADVNKS